MPHIKTYTAYFYDLFSLILLDSFAFQNNPIETMIRESKQRVNHFNKALLPTIKANRGPTLQYQPMNARPLDE